MFYLKRISKKQHYNFLDYYLTTIVKKLGGLDTKGLRGFLISFRRFVQFPPNHCAAAVCGLTA